MARRKAARTVRVVRPKDPLGLIVICLSIGKKQSYYVVREIRCDIGGRGFEVHRLGLGPMYHVRVGAPEEYSCECLGFLRHGNCKHVNSLAALIRDGQI